MSAQKRLVAVIVSCALALGGCTSLVNQGSVVRPVSVTSTTTDKFYYVRRDIFEQAGPDEHARQQQMLARPAFGPYQTNQTTLQLVVGLQYLFYPRCANIVSWNDAVSPVINSLADQVVKVDCANGGR